MYITQHLFIIFLPFFFLQVVPSAPVVGESDYSDPFDARPDPRPRPDWVNETVETCSSYMEPFEAQRFINGKSVLQ